MRARGQHSAGVEIFLKCGNLSCQPGTGNGRQNYASADGKGWKQLKKLVSSLSLSKAQLQFTKVQDEFQSLNCV